MPQAADITVKNGAAIDKTFTLLAPAAGMGGIAMWALKEGTISAVFPTFSARATTNANAVNHLRLKFELPSSYTDTVTGLTNVGSGVLMDASFRVPSNFPESLKNDYVAFVSNLMGNTLVKAMIRDALSAT